VLKLLSQEAGRVVSRGRDIQKGLGDIPTKRGSNIVDVYIKTLRSKLGDKPGKVNTNR
jgi:hypothetical protein